MTEGASFLGYRRPNGRVGVRNDADESERHASAGHHGVLRRGIPGHR